MEYLDGVVTQKVAGKYHHSTLQVGLILLMDGLIESNRVGRVFIELRTTFAGHSTVPDVCVYRTERIPRGSDGKPIADFRVPPDLAIEIFSPGETIRELSKKCQMYTDNGVAVALLVDYRNRPIRAFRPGVPMALRCAGDRIPLNEISPGMVLDVDEVFRPLDEW